MLKLKKLSKNLYILDKLNKKSNKFKLSIKNFSKEIDILKFNKKFLILSQIDKLYIQIDKFQDLLLTLKKEMLILFKSEKKQYHIKLLKKN